MEAQPVHGGMLPCLTLAVRQVLGISAQYRIRKVSITT